jgi:hypothetical protein
MSMWPHSADSRTLLNREQQINTLPPTTTETNHITFNTLHRTTHSSTFKIIILVTILPGV